MSGVLNSWGTDWGDDGFAYVSAGYVAAAFFPSPMASSSDPISYRRGVDLSGLNLSSCELTGLPEFVGIFDWWRIGLCW